MKSNILNKICLASLTTKNLKNSKIQSSITLKEALLKCGDPRPVLKMNTEDTATGTTFLLDIQQHQHQKHQKQQLQQQQLEHLEQHETINDKNPAAMVQQKINVAVTGVGLNCEDGSGGIAPTRQDVTKASNIMECLNNFIPGYVTVDFSQDDCKDVLKQMDQEIERKKKYFQQNSFTSGDDMGMDGSDGMEGKEPMCQSNHMCSEQHAAQVRAFLRNRNRESSSSYDDFVPPGWL